MTEQDLYRLLDAEDITYTRIEHPAVYTVEEADRLVQTGGTPVKNLFLCDDKKRAFYLVVVGAHTRVNLKELQHQLGSRRLSFASPELLAKKLGLIPGAVTVFGILNNDDHDVQLVVDEALQHTRIDAHPLVNTATITVSLDEVLSLFASRDIPTRFMAMA